jgi:multidrug efflux pump subunit AcrA (membrane-fusion protein)
MASKGAGKAVLIGVIGAVAVLGGGAVVVQRRLAAVRAKAVADSLAAAREKARAESLQVALHTAAAAESAHAAQAESLQGALRARAAAESARAAHERARVAALEKAKAESVEAERRRPKVLLLVDTPSLEIPNQKYSHFAFKLDGSANCTLRGRVLGLSGGAKDVEIYLLTDDDFVNWKSRAGAVRSAPLDMGLYHSPRQVATTLSVTLPNEPGTFHLVISNDFSGFTSKLVQARSEIICTGGGAATRVE